jgi:hypothetical protein
MRKHAIGKIKELKEMRKKGYSIPQLVNYFSIPKTTIWHHIQNIKLPAEKMRHLRNAGGESSRFRKEQALAKADKEAKELLNSSDKYLYGIAASLYWAEGSKGRCELVNTDGEMIRLYLRVLRELLRISEDRIEPVLRIFSNHNKAQCLNYWSDITEIPKTRFTILVNDGGTSGRNYGMCRIIIKKGGYVLKLFKAMIKEICV